MNVQPNDRSKPPANHSKSAEGSGVRGRGLVAGRKIGGVYVLKEEIIPSTSEPVWLAEDELLGKDVALHFLSEEISRDQNALKAIGHEIKKTRQLVHPNILRPYDLVIDGDLAAISTERFSGELVSAVLRDRPGQYFEPSDAKPLLRQICETLSDAHRIQAIHGRLNLDNVILTSDQRVLLRHFGTGRILAGGAQATEPVASVPDDLAALGAVVYRLLSGEEPARCTTGSGEKPLSMMEARARANRRGGTILPVWEKAVAAALSEDPAERPSSVTEFRERLGMVEKRAGARTSLPTVQPEASTATPAVEAEAPASTEEEPRPEIASPSRAGLRSTPSQRVGVQPRKPWIPDARPASDDDFITEDAAPVDYLSSVGTVPFTPTLPKHTQRILRVGAVVLVLAVIAGAALLVKYLHRPQSAGRSEAVVSSRDSASENASVADRPGDAATQAMREADKAELQARGNEPTAGSLDAQMREREEELRLAELAAADARELAERKALALEEARKALAALRADSTPQEEDLKPPGASGQPVSLPDLPKADTTPGPTISLGVLGDGENSKAEGITSSTPALALAVPADSPAGVAANEGIAAPPVRGKAAEAPVSATEPEGANETSQAFENSLGMRFVPIGDVQFCIWPTRVQDYAAYANDVRLKSTAWRQPGFKQAPDHPVIRISWNHAMAFCKWLTDRERASGVLSENEIYRLASDSEWSSAVGLPEEPGKYPADRDGRIPDVYPWGEEWPPKTAAGNYNGQETGDSGAISGYQDDYVKTSPVGAFPANDKGIHDLGGNVWQWCADLWKKGGSDRVMRGASYADGAKRNLLWSCARLHTAPDSMNYNTGFRIVKAPASPTRRKP